MIHTLTLRNLSTQVLAAVTSKNQDSNKLVIKKFQVLLQCFQGPILYIVWHCNTPLNGISGQ